MCELVEKDFPCLEQVFPLMGLYVGYTPVRLHFRNLNVATDQVAVSMDYENVETKVE
jgi:hypothetical protein